MHGRIGGIELLGLVSVPEHAVFAELEEESLK